MSKPRNVNVAAVPPPHAAAAVAAAAAVDTFKIFRQKINETDINIRHRTHGNQMHLIALS